MATQTRLRGFAKGQERDNTPNPDRETFGYFYAQKEAKWDSTIKTNT